MAITINGVLFDWTDTFAQSALEWVLREWPEIAHMGPLTLISCVDSSRREDLHSFNVPLFSRGSLRSDGVLVNTADLVALERSENLFHGFDELWFLEHEPSTVLPEVVITSETPLVSDNSGETRQLIANWMLAEGCALGIGDGCGLNLATTQPELADSLKRMAALIIERSEKELT